MMADPFGVDVLFKHKNKDVKTHKTNVKIENEKTTKKAISKFKYKDENKLFGTHRGDSRAENNRVGEKRVGELDREFFNMISSKKKGKTSSSSATPSYDVILSVSTIVNNGQRKISKPMNVMGHTPSLLERVPHLRKLMQVEEEDEEGLGYEDVNEVLADDNEGHDDTDKGQDRKKRMDFQDYKVEDFKVPSNPYKYNPPGVHNPNWKGPMPLYPDELSSMIKQAAMQNVQNFNKIYLPANTKDASSEADNSETELNDMEYIENYSDNKFENLARMAQAYSDYGVLEGRKEQSRNEKAMDGKNAERRIKLSVKGRSFKDALFDRFKKSKVSEGIRFEIRPTTPSREDSPIELMKVLEKHVKVTKNKYFPPFHSTTLPLNTDYALFSAIQKQQSQMMANDASTKKGEQPNEYPDNAVVFTLAKSGRRSLKSVPDEENYKSNEEFDENEKSLEDKLIVKGISGLGAIKADDKPSTDKNTKTAEEHHHHHHKHHHHSDHNHHNISNVNETTSKLEIIEDKSLILNETDRLKENVTANNASDSHSNGLAVIPDNNLIATILNLNAPRNKSEMDLSDFFMLMSNWFSVMAGLDTSSETNEPKSNIIKLITKSDASTTPTSNDSINIEFPMYDSDMIENIGHRSRVLMAIEDSDKSTENAVSEVNTSVMNGKDEITSASPVITINKEDVSTATALTSATETITAIATQSQPAEKLIITKNEETFDNKTVVKRNIPEDSNLIFWNDIYDDEYGVKMEPIDNTVIDKRNSKNLNFMKKSGDWIHEKVKNIANNFHGKDKFESKYKTKQRRVMRRANYRNDMYTKYNKRAARYEEADEDEKTGSFAQLTVKMKEVCKEAAKAVQQTKNVQVRQDEKEDSMTTSLMQQLVRLMTDLIDFQVQQKTCVKLPPDLQDFLVWLTNPNSDQEVEFRDQKMSYREDNSYEKPSDQILDLISTPSSEKEEIHGDSRSECLGTLHAVQDLMQQYDEMTDEDKSKMTGIRDYLQNQLQFLHKQLATFNDYKMTNIFEDQNPSYRFRREVPKQNCRRRSNQIKSRRNRNRFKRKFLKNFGKKHTRTTASIYDGFAMTEVNKFTKDDKYGAEKDGKDVKRNLKDVYYKALNDAKKSTTFKTASKDEMEGFDHAQIVRMDN
ncbi:uncharacterized protein LOC135084960 [Ostrinia nubilalis]|uniref:uncharacterized protein LOC135084960 n=1 Tax=Ostrinia nubilalis TaxID=29057 RepID=UPI0030826005